MFGFRGSLRSHPTLALPCTQGREPFFAIIKLLATLAHPAFIQATDESGARLYKSCRSQRSAVPTMKSRSS